MPSEGIRNGRTAPQPIAPEEFDPRAVGRRLDEVITSPSQHQRALVGGLPAEGLGERGLADPRLPADQDQAARTGERGVERLAQQGELAIAADEGWGRSGSTWRRGWCAGPRSAAEKGLIGKYSRVSQQYVRTLRCVDA